MLLPDNVHSTAAIVKVSAGFAFERLASAEFVGRWSLGSMDMEPVGPSLYKGRSLFDGSNAFVEFRPVPELGLIDYAVGSSGHREPRIFIRVTDGQKLEHDAKSCLVSLHALRSCRATDETWARTCTSHETEILLIKAQLETAWAAR